MKSDLATPKQIAYIQSLASRLHKAAPHLEEMSKAAASNLIDTWLGNHQAVADRKQRDKDWHRNHRLTKTGRYRAKPKPTLNQEQPFKTKAQLLHKDPRHDYNAENRRDTLKEYGH